MSSKKRFSIAPELASGIRSTIQSAEHNSGQLHYDMMSIEVIEPDPENPRTLHLTREDMRQGESGLKQLKHLSETERKEIEGILELAASIKRVGIRNAIEVYKVGEKYRIISGARRYLAAILAGQDYVPARISQKPDEFKLRYMQWVENINREDLSLLDKYNNLLAIANAHNEATKSAITPQKLMELLGISSSQTYRYFALLNAGSEVIDLLKKGKLSNLKIVEELEAVKDPILRKNMIEQIAKMEPKTFSLNHYKLIQKNNKRKTPIATLKVHDHMFARALYQLMLGHVKQAKLTADNNAIDWKSPRAVNNAFKKLFSQLENEFQLQEQDV